MLDRFARLALLELLSIVRAHIANCTLIDSEGVRSRNLDRLSVLENQIHDYKEAES